MVDCTSIQTLLASPSCLLKRGRKTSKFALLNFLQFVYSHFLVFFAFFKSSHCTSFAKLIYFNSAETNSTLLVQKVPKHNLYHIVSLSRHVYIFIWHTKEFFFKKRNLDAEFSLMRQIEKTFLLISHSMKINFPSVFSLLGNSLSDLEFFYFLIFLPQIKNFFFHRSVSR